MGGNQVQRNKMYKTFSDLFVFIMFLMLFPLLNFLQELKANKMLTGLAITSFPSSGGANEQ